jgi:predicted DNA-binding transcriptional regulator AlpA
VLDGELARLTDGNKLARPVPVRDRSGKWHRNPGGEWDWFYALADSERLFIQRTYMVADGLAPDVLATRLVCSVDEAMERWLSAARAERASRPKSKDLLSDDYEAMEYDNVRDAIELIRERTDLTDDQWDILEQMVRDRANGQVPSTRTTEKMAQNEAWTMPRTAKYLNRADIAKVLGSPAITIYKWSERGKLPKPDAVIGTRPAWTRSTVKRFCAELVELRG